MKITLLSIVLLVFFSINIGNSMELDPPTAVKVVEVDFPIFKDMDYKVIYVDFELLSTNIKSLKIIKSKGEVKFQDDVSKERVDAIYEINYSDYTPGIYKIQLLTYSGNVLNSSFIIE